MKFNCHFSDVDGHFSDVDGHFLEFDCQIFVLSLSSCITADVLFKNLEDFENIPGILKEEIFIKGYIRQIFHTTAFETANQMKWSSPESGSKFFKRTNPGNHKDCPYDPYDGGLQGCFFGVDK